MESSEDQLKDVVGTIFLGPEYSGIPTASADPLARRGFSRSASSTYRTGTPVSASLARSHGGLRSRPPRYGIPEQSGPGIFFATFWLTFAYGIFRWIKRLERADEPPSEA